MTTVLEIAGAGCLVGAAWLVAMPLGLAVLGVMFLTAAASATRKAR